MGYGNLLILIRIIDFCESSLYNRRGSPVSALRVAPLALGGTLSISSKLG